MDFDGQLRRDIYDATLTTGAPPTVDALTRVARRDPRDVRLALQQLATARVIVLQPGNGEILMAPPFSAVPTPFVVTTARHTSYANCAWDALGVAVMMRSHARVTTACACCGDAIALDVDPDQPPRGTDVVHFALPAARWWDDIVFT
jgi:Alkylmercury lyase